MTRDRSDPAGRRFLPRLAGLAFVVAVAAPACAMATAAPAAVLQAQDDSAFAALRARHVGPANMSGRTAAIDATPDGMTIWVGAATGGVWKSEDGGLTWEPKFDDQPASSIGAVALDPRVPDVVWVGTGEANPRNSMGTGRGVFRTVDGGESWQFLGLERSERISRLLLHPQDPDIAYVAALGPAWSEGGERGVYKTADGGRTWERVLYVNPSTGAADLVMDPANPDHLIAAMWDYRRWPWTFRSGGPGSGLHVTWDGGRTWKRLTEDDGLPEGELGRTGLAFARSNPAIVYALVEAERNALLRSEDGGRTWRTVNSDTNVNPRPFYYADIRVDPVNENRVYRLASFLDMSEDGGRTFRGIATYPNGVHPDHHALWISPDGRTLIDGNDGGVYISPNRGRSWRFVTNLPFGQFYHISVDMARPFNILGGMQDNGSWMGPSAVWEVPSFRGDNVTNEHWRTIGFGDGFASLVDPNDASYGYSMSQGGYLNRFDLRTGEWKSIRPPPPDRDTRLRFNWNAGIAADPFRPGTIYYGSQFVHMSSDRGQTWTIISPDLTTNNPEWQKQAESGGLTKDVTAAENFTTILTIAPSPVERGLIWVGTDDGNVQITRDGGRTWTNVVGRIRGMPANTWVPHIEASRYDAGTAYVVFDNHQRGDFATYVYRTTDYGRSWRSLATADIDGFAHTIEEDPVAASLLWVGTEFGLFYSVNGGQNWQKWIWGVPTVPVRSLVTHPRDHDLAIGTHGRGAYVLDDVRPLRALAQNRDILAQPLHLFAPPPAYLHNRGLTGPYYFPGSTFWEGENTEYGALLTFWQRDEVDGDTLKATVEILDGDGVVIKDFREEVRQGMNRVTWNLQREGFPRPRDRGPFARGEEDQDREWSGPEVLPGTFTVVVKVGDSESRQRLEVQPDPRREVPIAARGDKLEAMQNVALLIEDVAEAVERLHGTRETLDFLVRRLGIEEGEAADSLEARAERLRERAGELLDQLRDPSDVKGIVEETSIYDDIGSLFGRLGSSYDAPTAGQMLESEWYAAQLTELLEAIDEFYADEVGPFEQDLRASGINIFPGVRPREADGP